MKRRLALVAVPLLMMATPSFVFAQTSSSTQTPRKPAAKTSPKPAAKPPAKAAAKSAPSPAPADFSITNSYAIGDKTTAGTVLMHGQRQRLTSDGILASIQMCDRHRGVQLNTTTRVFLETPDPEPASVSATPAGEKHKGGRITYTTMVVDTGEAKEMFGFTAHHLKTTVTKEASPDACDKRPEKVEIDGWYIDLPNSVCTGAPPPQQELRVDQKDASCSDTVSYVRPPASKAYPVNYTMVTTAGADSPLTTKMEATDVKRTTLDPGQFEIPSDYIPVKNVAQLTMDHRPGEVGAKKPGTLRIGAAPVANTSDQPVSTAALSHTLVESYEETQTDIVALKGRTPAEQADEAKTLECDYVLSNTVSEIKHPGRGMLGRIGGANADALSAKVEYALVPPGAAKAAFAGSERSGTSMVQTAVGAAKRVSQYVMPMMLGYGYMRAFSAMSGSATPGPMRQTQDPMVSAVFSLVDRATGNKPQPELTTPDGAAAAALQKEIDSVVAELKKRKS
ncbi:MAG: hypothetical protein ACRD1V_12520 [Vicinamibacterales bacterium]